MVYKRKEDKESTRIKTYKFRIYPTELKADFEPEEKQAFFAEARAMNAFWNKLVTIRASVLEELGADFDKTKLEFVEDEKEKMTFARLKQLSPEFAARSADLWKTFETRTKALAQSEEIKASLGWESREDVFSRFETTHRKTLKVGGELRFKSEKFIEQFHLPHRFSGGGKKLIAFRTGRSKKLYIENLPDKFYEEESYQNRKSRIGDGRIGFGIEDVHQLPFRILMHRRVPEDAKIKTAILTGSFRNRKWKYYLVLAVEETFAPSSSKSGNLPVAGLDLGWRKFDDYLRVGCVVDSYGNAYELRLPLNPAPNQNYRRMQQLRSKHGETKSYPQNWQDIEDAQTLNSNAKDLIKGQIKELTLPANAEIKILRARWDRVGKRGLLKLQRILCEENAEDSEDVQRALLLLDRWKEETLRREDEIEYARQRLLNQRKYYYAQIGKWLKNNYAAVALNADLSLRHIAIEGANAKMSEENGAVHRNSAKYRFIAALYELKTAINAQPLPGEEWLKNYRSASATAMKCYICEAECEKTTKLKIICPQGHPNDQDIQAAIILRNSLPEVSIKHKIFSDIPGDLKSLIVPLASDL